MGENKSSISSIGNDQWSDVEAWLIDSGIASVTAAVHLIKDAGVLGSNTHILDENTDLGGVWNLSGILSNVTFFHLNATHISMVGAPRTSSAVFLVSRS